RKNHLDLSVGIALGSAAQIALFVAPVLVLLSYFIGPVPMDLNLWPGAVAMILFATLTASLVTTSGRSTWFVGAMAIMIYLIFATALYLLPPAGNKRSSRQTHPVIKKGRNSGKQKRSSKEPANSPNQFASAKARISV